MATTNELCSRLARIEGQIASIRRSLESGDPDCTKTLTQTKAASQALKRFTEAFSRDYAKRCVARKHGSQALARELDEIIGAAFTLS